MKSKLLDGKRVLIVDDEPDVLKTLSELLNMCYVQEAATFQEARELLEKDEFDIAVLDIMGVDGFALLGISKEKNVMPVMLTAHALNAANVVKSFKEGAASFLPKEEIMSISDFLEELLEAKEKREHFWSRWFTRWGSYFERKFGPDWQKEDKEFWEKFQYWGE